MKNGIHGAVEPDLREVDSADGADAAVVVGDLAPDHGPILVVNMAGEVEAEACVAIEDADRASWQRLTDLTLHRPPCRPRVPAPPPRPARPLRPAGQLLGATCSLMTRPYSSSHLLMTRKASGHDARE